MISILTFMFVERRGDTQVHSLGAIVFEAYFRVSFGVPELLGCI